MQCLFCNAGDKFNTVEHIIPESLGNNDLILRNEVCDKCQTHLSKIEKYVLSNTPIGFWRTYLGIKTKKGKLPSVDFTKKDQSKGILPDHHKYHDNVRFVAHEDYSTEIVSTDKTFGKVEEDGKGEFKYVFTPKVIFEIGRFLGKIGLEMICSHDRDYARCMDFDSIRRYIRIGLTDELWPIFHGKQGELNELISWKKQSNQIAEEVFCYDYSLLRFKNYEVFKIVIGLDSWAICLNNIYPHPNILEMFGDDKPQLMWYPSESWKNVKNKINE